VVADTDDFLSALRKERAELIKQYNDRIAELRKCGFKYSALPDKLLVVVDKTESVAIH